MHPIVENAYAKFNKIIATYDVGGLSGRIWNDYHNGFSPISYTSVNLFDYVYAIGSIELNTVPTIPTFKAVGGLIGEVEAVVTNAFVNVDITPSTFDGLAIGAVFGIVTDPLTSQEVDHISPITQLGKIYYDSNVILKVGSNELSVANGYDDIPVQITDNIISDDILDVLNLNFLTTVGNWTSAAWDVAATPNNNSMWNLLDYSLTLSDQLFFTITATLGAETIPIYDLNPIIVRESNEDNSLFPDLVFTLTLNTSYYSYYVPEDPVAFNAPNTTIGFSRQIPTGMTIVHSINSNEMTITLSASDALDTDLIDQFSGYINVFTTKIIPGNPLGSPDRLEYGVINLPTIMFVFVETEITEQ